VPSHPATVDRAPAGTKPSSSSALKLRIASALVMGPVALAAVWFGTPYFPLLVTLLAVGMAREWARLSGGDALVVRASVMLTLVATVAATALALPLLALILAVIGTAATWIAARLSAAPAPSWTALGTLWLAIPCLAILWIGQGTKGRAAILWLFAVVWASDIGAYAAGRAFGGPRLAPLLSPNKTWAGAIGGFVASGFVGWGAALILDAPVAVMVATSLVLSIAAQLGDLAESLAKRHFGAKDSGALIPGHGGLLDRLDSLLTAAAVLGLLTLIGADAALYP
jgi:phosphatidate cytidylyltransferase